MTLTFPDTGCPQSHIDPWWVRKEGAVGPGCLVRGFLPHTGQVPLALVAQGRTDARNHQLADCEIVPVSIEKIFPRSKLPVAALPCFDGEIRAVYRAKKRPALVLADPGPPCPSDIMKDKPKSLTAPTLLVAPYYGCDEGTGKRAGYSRQFIERVQKCAYPQFVWDMLPIEGAQESILRLDHIQPLSSHYVAYAPTGWALSGQALEIIQEWMGWHLFGTTPDPDNDASMLGYLRGVLSGEE